MRQARDVLLQRKSEAKEAAAMVERCMTALQAVIYDQQMELPLAAPDAWREKKIESLGLSATIIKKLSEAADGDTIGHLADWLKKDGNEFGKIIGFGEQAVEKIEKAMDDFWAENRIEKVKPEPSDDDDSDEPESDEESQ